MSINRPPLRWAVLAALALLPASPAAADPETASPAPPPAGPVTLSRLAQATQDLRIARQQYRAAQDEARQARANVEALARAAESIRLNLSGSLARLLRAEQSPGRADELTQARLIVADLQAQLSQTEQAQSASQVETSRCSEAARQAEARAQRDLAVLQSAASEGA